MEFQNTAAFAQELDKNDKLAKYRSKYFMPKMNGKEALYFTGNSLGLQPVSTKSYLQQELDDWAQYGVEGHFEAKRPWYAYHENLTDKVSKIVGAKPEEIVVTHSLTTNLHLLMVSFYGPTSARYKIICEEKPFPSDIYALQSQVKFHGYDPEEAIVTVGPREGEHNIRLEDILAKIEEVGDELALVMIGGVNYYSGQVFDMKTITEAAHNAGSMCGFDLAHGAGNIELKLHEWNVDFATWCGYKYLNSSPGGVSGMFIHENHATNTELVRFAGWWGNNKEERFQMKPEFNPIPTAEGWQLSNAPVLGMAAHLAALEIFDEVGMPALCEKRDVLTAYLEFIINDISARNEKANFEIITPSNLNERGCQISMLAHGQGKELFDELTKQGVIADWREPNVIRLAPVPMYNSFEDVYQFGQILEKAL